MKRIAVLTSGGDAPGMNAVIRAIVRSGISRRMEVYGIYDGYRGLLEGKIKKFSRGDVSDIIIKGGTILGTARLDEFRLPEVQDRAVEILREHKIEALVVIGGDGSYKGALALSERGISCIGIPGTIDNDIASTEYSIGFDTALNTIVENVDKLRDTSSSHHRCTVVEVMGNQCGDLALFAGLTCGAEVVITKETGFDEALILERLAEIEAKKKKRHAIVIISEKITDVELFASKISQHTDFSGRATVLGHIQRGGSPSARDRTLATEMGDYAVALIAANKKSECVGVIDGKVQSLPIRDALQLTRPSRRELFELQERLV